MVSRAGGVGPQGVRGTAVRPMDGWMKQRFSIRLLVTVGVLVWGAFSASGLSTVFSPDVKAGDRSVEYRFSYVEETERQGHRFHAQWAHNETVRSRLVLAGRKDEGADFDYRFTRLETLWQFAEDEEAGYDGAVRLDLQAADGDNEPHRIGTWLVGQYEVADGWRLRGGLFGSYEIGPGRDEGIGVQARGAVLRRVISDWTAGLEYFGNLNTTEDFGSFDEQRHQVGFLLRTSVLGLALQGRMLVGVSEGASDLEVRLNAGWSF